MRNTDYFKGKKVTVVGLARSGVASANLLFGLGADVSVTDNNDTEAIRQNLSQLKSEKIKVEIGRHTHEFIKGRDIVIISPGVPYNALVVSWADALKIPVISEIEFAFLLCPATVIAITGSSGKTTVTTLIGKIIAAAGKKAFVCGNIGNPFSAAVEKMQPGDFVSLEVSSFQLEKINTFKPKIALMLNFSRNHLDRHKDMQEYLEAKKRIFVNQDQDDFLVLNEDDPVLKGFAKEAKAKVIYFKGSKDSNPNQAAALSVAAVLGIDQGLCLKVFGEFKGLEHRFEYVTEVNKVKFINDSKATVVESTVWAIKNIPSSIILIAGGKDKGVDYRGIIKAADKKVKEVILIGQARAKIRQALGGSFVIEEATGLEEAVNKAYLKASPGDYVLLSPMCSSFDMFSNYEERGNCFKKAVYDLAAVKA